MDTVYYDLSARRIKVSGGADLVKLLAAPAALPQGGAQVLDFDRCRRRLETKSALRDLEAVEARCGGPLPEDLPVQPRPRREHRDLIGLALEVCASLAVIAVSLAAVWAFLGL